MNSVTASGCPVIYYSDWPTETPISAGNPEVISRPFQLAYANGCSLQLLCDGGASITYTIQVTNLPKNFGQYGFKWNNSGERDDSFASLQWDTMPNGTATLAAGTPTITTLFADSTIFQHGRMLFKYTGGGSAKVLVTLAAASV